MRARLPAGLCGYTAASIIVVMGRADISRSVLAQPAWRRPPAGRRFAAAVPPANAFTHLGLVLLMPFLFFLFSRLLDVTIPQLHLPLVFGSLAVAATLLEGSLGEVLQYYTARWLVLFSIWFAAAATFGLWRGGSFAVFRSYWIKSFMIFLALACLVSGLKRIRWGLRTMTLAISLSAVAGLLIHDLDREGRLRLPAGELANSNAFGIIMVLGLTLCWYTIAHPLKSVFWRLAALPVMLPILYAAARSGSRTALLAATVTFAYLFLRLPPAQKARAALLAIPLVGGLVVTVPYYLQERLATLVVTDPEGLGQSPSELERSALTSTLARWRLLERSLLVTLENPLLGVGPGNFMVAEDLMAKREARPRGAWRVTHNGYTEISSEMGLPGLLFYCAAIVAAWVPLRRLSRLKSAEGPVPEIRHTALSLQAALFCMCVAVGFGISLYSYYVPSVLGLAVGFVRWAEATVAALSSFGGSRAGA